MANRTVTYRVEEQHAVTASRLVMRRRLKMPVAPTLIIAVVVATFAIVIDRGGMLGYWTPILAWLVLAMAFILAVVHYWVLPRQARRMYQQTSLLQESITLEWDEGGYALNGERGSARLKWKELYAWAEDDSLFLLMQSEMLYNLVPKSALDEGQIADLRQCLEGAELKKL